MNQDEPSSPGGARPLKAAPHLRLYAHHPRRWGDFQYVYPVLSRRAGGLSIGVNLNIDKACNFDCIYCQVDRTQPPPRKDVDLSQMADELGWMLRWAASGEIWNSPQFASTPAALRRINDVAFSGDGEPTAFPQFDLAVEAAVNLRDELKLPGVRIIVLTNATLLDRPAVQRGLEKLYKADGRLWAKLDAGTEAYYKLVDRTSVGLAKVLANIGAEGARHPLIIQSLFMRVHGEPTPAAEFEAYLDRLERLRASGCRIELAQLYTIARQTTEAYATPLSREELDGMAARFHQRLPDIQREVYYGVG